MPKLLFATVLILASSVIGHAQTAPAAIAIPAVPLTKLEQVQASTGAPLVRSFSRIGEMSGSLSRGGGTVSLEALELFNTSNGERQFGLAIEVAEGGHPDHTNRSLIDYEEINGLLAGIDYISRVDPKVVKFDSYRADYSTRDYFRVSVFMNISGKEPSISIISGLSPCTVNFNFNDLAKFRDYIVMGKTKIEAVMK